MVERQSRNGKSFRLLFHSFHQTRIPKSKERAPAAAQFSAPSHRSVPMVRAGAQWRWPRGRGWRRPGRLCSPTSESGIIRWRQI